MKPEKPKVKFLVLQVLHNFRQNSCQHMNSDQGLGLKVKLHDLRDHFN